MLLALQQRPKRQYPHLRVASGSGQTIVGQRAQLSERRFRMDAHLLPPRANIEPAIAALHGTASANAAIVGSAVAQCRARAKNRSSQWQTVSSTRRTSGNC